MVSAANAQLATGHDRVVVIAPIAEGYGAIPGAREDVGALESRAQALLVAPDERSVDAIGPNIYDRSAAYRQRGPDERGELGSPDAVAAIWSL